MLVCKQSLNLAVIIIYNKYKGNDNINDNVSDNDNDNNNDNDKNERKQTTKTNNKQQTTNDEQQTTTTKKAVHTKFVEKSIQAQRNHYTLFFI